jgi:glucose-6-phosphate dehydrogenase assembly protein OpcA
MATVYKTLGQSSPSATTETTLYTVPAATSAITSSIVVCNRSSVLSTFRVSVAVGGGATANKDYIYYDLPIGANDTFIATVGLTLAATDVVRVYASNTNLSFSLYGSQIT